MSSNARKWLRLLASLLVLLVLGWVFRDELDFITDASAACAPLTRSRWRWLSWASIASIWAMGEVMRLLLAAGGLRIPSKETAALTLASNAWSTTLPAGPTFSAVLTFHVQRTWGASVVLCGWFLVLSSAVSTMWLVLIGIGGVLFLNADMAFWSLIATLAGTVAVAAVLFWMINNPAKIERWLRNLKMLKGSARERVMDQVHSLYEVSLTPWQFSQIAFYSLANRLLDMLSLWACLWAVTGTPPGFSAAPDHTSIAGVALAYLTAKLAGSAQVTPAGLGTVEAAIVATLVATGMTAVDATGAAIIYRLISFALITVIGWVIYFMHYARKGITYAALNRKEA
ncbi:Putative integral membrane protein [Corynebacterium camporealensis]|uniref:lysylphosphatidylglycerol synthase transmembrane domain-containing protein n=1 Tax=Corynebacterium camporealensis TaxID=161896 RepID=UPI000CF9DC88|nr:YbhN family protein [Corynebacterium camporealensis]AVH89144.1 Putative integral membrane protein [Corynebacterium camporealensis]